MLISITIQYAQQKINQVKNIYLVNIQQILKINITFLNKEFKDGFITRTGYWVYKHKSKYL